MFFLDIIVAFVIFTSLFCVENTINMLKRASNKCNDKVKIILRKPDSNKIESEFYVYVNI